MQVQAFASTRGEAQEQIKDICALVDDGQVIAGPLVVAQHSEYRYFVVADQITWQADLVGQDEWIPREMWNI